MTHDLGLVWPFIESFIIGFDIFNLISERLKHIIPCLRRHTQPEATEATTENNESITLERRSTFPPLASRSSTFDQKLPPYSRQDPLPQSPHVSIIEEDISGEVSRAVTPI